MAVYVRHVLSTDGPQILKNSLKSLLVALCLGSIRTGHDYRKNNSDNIHRAFSIKKKNYPNLDHESSVEKNDPPRSFHGFVGYFQDWKRHRVLNIIKDACETKNGVTFTIKISYIAKIVPVRWTKHHRKVKKLPKRFIPRVPVEAKLDSLASKGFLRNITSYRPPENSLEKLLKLFREVAKTDDPQYIVTNEQKFQLLSALSREFSYTVPNSLLHKMVSLGNIQEFYSTPVENIVPYDKLKNADLPPNLHIMYDYHRFHPDTDTMFNGVSAFPKSSTIVSGLKTKEKYKGYDAGSPWHDI